MKKWVLGLVLLFTLSSLPASSTTPPKPGSICPKQGITKTYKGKKYTCIRSGKKLVWNKGVTVKTSFPIASPTLVPSPTPTPENSASPTPYPSTSISSSPDVSPSPTSFPDLSFPFAPWSNLTSAKLVSEAAQKSFREWADNQNSSPSKHLLIYQDNVPPLRLSYMKKSDEISSRLFSQFFPNKSVTVIGTTEDWVVSQILSSGGSLENTRNTCKENGGDGIDLCMNRIAHQGYVVKKDQSANPLRPSLGSAALIAHEYFHLVQIALSDNVAGPHWNFGDTSSANAFPVWFVEGSAEFVGFSISSVALGHDYWLGRPNTIVAGSSDFPNLANALADYEVRIKGAAGAYPQKEGVWPYSMGMIATEYLVASIGFSKFLEIWRDYKITRNFNQSFERVTGVTKTFFYDSFESARTSLGLPPVTWKLNGIKNEKINN